MMRDGKQNLVDERSLRDEEYPDMTKWISAIDKRFGEWWKNIPKLVSNVDGPEEEKG